MKIKTVFIWLCGMLMSCSTSNPKNNKVLSSEDDSFKCKKEGACIFKQPIEEEK